MHIAKVTSKGQITIPLEVREAMDLKPGSRIVFFETENDQFIVRAAKSAMELDGCVAGLGLPKADEELNTQLHHRASELDDASRSGARQLSDGEAA